jgi:hypothetical protein
VTLWWGMSDDAVWPPAGTATIAVLGKMLQENSSMLEENNRQPSLRSVLFRWLSSHT